MIVKFTSWKVEALFLTVVAPKFSGKIASGMQVEMIETWCIYLLPRSGFILMICWYGKDIWDTVCIQLWIMHWKMEEISCYSLLHNAVVFDSNENMSIAY